MPIRFLLYVAITALTRLLIGDVSHHNPPDLGIIYLCGGILLLAFSILVVRYASARYPSVKEKAEG
jgi:phosphate starvation-inducible membrane PsiE